MYSTDGYQALRDGSAVVRRGDRGVLGVSGPDRLVWLQGLLTNDVAALRTGESCYAAYLTPQGRMIADMRVVQLDDRTLLEVPALLAEALRAKLDSLLFAEDAQVADLSGSFEVLDVLGPDARRVVDLARAAAPALTAVPMAEDDGYGVPAMTFFADAAIAPDVLKALTDAGAVETTLETLDVLRIEAGRPLFLVDMDEHTIPLEAGIEDRAISFTKGCYVGQEVIVRVLHRGHGRVARKLVGLLLPKDSTPRPGDLIRRGGREIGRVTSTTWSPALEQPIALAYVHRDFIEPGSQVDVQAQEAATPAMVAALPFVGRRYTP
jgi:folate-binding protein YgfZ